MFTEHFDRRDWCLMALVITIIIAQVYLDLRIPGYMGDITNALQNDTDAVAENGIGMAVCALASLCCSVVTGALASLIAADYARALRKKQFDRVQSFSKEDVEKFSAASLITRSTNDVYHVQVFFAIGLTVAVKEPILAVWAILKINGGAFEWTAATAVAALLLVAVDALTLYFTIPRFKKIQWLTDGINSASRENLDGIKVIRAYNAEEYQSAKFNKANDGLLENNIRAMRNLAFMYPSMSLIQNILAVSIYWIGAMLIMKASSHAEQMALFTNCIVFTSYALQVMLAFMMMSGIFRMLPRVIVSYKRVEEVIAHEPTVKDRPGCPSEDGGSGTIEFRNVSFAYPGAPELSVSNISFKASKGETVAIVGSTGSGKSTLVNLAERFYDVTGGEILVDGIDIRLYPQEALRRKIGYVPQQSIIFSGSVRDNVNYGDGSEKKTDEDILRALRIAQADSFVNDLEGGLDAVISQHGNNISGGQKQRIAIARAVCRDPEIYLLDDCFSALDYRTDMALRRSLKDCSGGKTKIMVTQRIGTVMDADRIVVLDRGEMVGCGTHGELMGSCEVYREIAASQLTGVS